MNSIDSTYAKLSEQCYDFHADVGLFFVIVFPVLNLEIQKFGPKNPGSFWLFFFSECLHRVWRALWLGSGRHFRWNKKFELCAPWRHGRIQHVFFWKPILIFHPNSFCLKFCVCFFFQSKIRQTKIKCLINFPIKNKWFLLKQSKIRCLPFMFMPWFLFPWKKYLENFFFWSHFP